MSFRFNFQAADSTSAPSGPSVRGHVKEIEAEEVIYSTATKVGLATGYPTCLYYMGSHSMASVGNTQSWTRLHALAMDTICYEMLQDAAGRRLEDVVLSPNISLKKVGAPATCDALNTCHCSIFEQQRNKGYFLLLIDS